MKNLSHKSIPELQALLGEQLKQLRISKDVDQITTAEKAGISEKSLRNLEDGSGSTVGSLLRVLKALNSLDGLQLIAPRPSDSPLPLLPHSKVRRRVRRSWRAMRASDPPGQPDLAGPSDAPGVAEET
jgi:transcriptional regulator with XRE-family HTH domain